MSRADRLILSSPDWATFWTILTTQSQVDPGDAFERLTQLYLLSHPEYRTQLKHVWRVPEEVPPRLRERLNLPSTDEGIDLLAETHEGAFWAIQCKFRSDTKKPLTYGELSTFTSLAFVTCTGISLAVVAHTCSKPVRKHKLLGNATEIGLDRWLGLTEEDWRAIQGQIKGKAIRLAPRVPRPHQQKAIEAAHTHYATASRGRMIMPCATGKSLTAFWIAQALDAKSILVAVPSLALIRQSLLDWTREYLAHGEVPQWLVVCSDESTGNLDRDEFVGNTYDLGIPTTTKSEDIVPFLRKRKGRRIVFTTYQSSGVLAEAAREAGITFDLAILDEAHKTVGVKGKTFATLLSDENLAVRWRLFMTATERVLRGENDDVFSMDDEAVYGKRFHQLTFKDAIGQGIISDYKILTITVSDAAIQDLIEENRLIDVEGDETDAQSLAAAVALRRTFEKHGVTHAISFHRSIKAASTFSDRQSVLDNAMRPRLTSLHVSSKKTAGERAELMRQFVSEERALMTNARCLTEGVDVPAIDCVLFADPKHSVVDIVQAAGRALRPFPGKECGYILLPLVVPTGMDVDTFAESTAFKQVARTITALSTQDERIAEQFRVVEHGRTPKGKIVEIEGDVPVGQRLNVSEFADQIGTRIWERVAKVNWRPFDEAHSIARSLHLRSFTEWRVHLASKTLPKDLPTNPNVVYRGAGWKNWGDWLGSGNVASRLKRYREFDDARQYARSLHLRSVDEWGKRFKAGLLPADLSRQPNRTYAKRGWSGWSDWLGTGRLAHPKEPFLAFEDARAYARTLGLLSGYAWKRFYKTGACPTNVPKYPDRVYRESGWVGWDDWLGAGWRPFEEARRFARSQGLKGLREWREYSKSGERPSDIPSNPWDIYRERGWIDLGDWLGIRTFAARGRKFKSFEDARVFARSLHLHTLKDWQDFAKSDQRPADIPWGPAQTYANRGWAGIRDWLGSEDIVSQRKRYRSFNDAVAYVREQRLRSKADWREYCKSGKRPIDIPAHPEVTYRDRGWEGWPEWLGVERKRRAK